MDIDFVDSDSDASTETSDSEDQDRSELVFGEHARSILSSLDESIGKMDDFLAFERGFTIGEIVCSATDPSGQLGRVVDVDLVVDLETNSGALIRDINSKKLLRLRSFAYGDWCKLPVDHCVNLLMATEEPESLTSPICLSKMQKELDIENPQMYVIAKTKSKFDILWQNGKKSVGVDPQSLSPVSNLGDHDFWPEHFVPEKVTLEDAHVQGTQRFGIVKNVESSEQTVEVKWILSEFSKNVDVSGESTEVMSVYELIEHPDLSFSIGDVVLQQNPSLRQVEENMLDAQMSYQKERNNLAGAVDRLSYEKEILEKPIVEFHKSICNAAFIAR